MFNPKKTALRHPWDPFEINYSFSESWMKKKNDVEVIRDILIILGLGYIAMNKLMESVHYELRFPVSELLEKWYMSFATKIAFIQSHFNIHSTHSVFKFVLGTAYIPFSRFELNNPRECLHTTTASTINFAGRHSSKLPTRPQFNSIFWLLVQHHLTSSRLCVPKTHW